MSDEQDKLKLSLEPPKLFGRKKKTADEAAAAAPEAAAPQAARPTTPTAEESSSDAPAIDEPVIDEPVEEPIEEPTVVLEPVEVEAEVEAEVEVEPEITETEEAPTVIQEAVEPEPEPVVAAKPAPAAKAVKPRPVAKPAAEPEPRPVTAAEDTEIAAQAAQGPLLSLYRAAALTGFVVGASMVVLTWLSLRGCEAVRGTSSCGGGPGFLLLIATFALCVLLGSALLKAFMIPDPGSSSFLAVGLVAVVALLFLIDFLDEWAMLIVIPVLSIGGYLASVWVTKTFVEPVDT